ncbi:putative cupin superfamily sugar epimerase [Janthinobacterium sp. CG_23.3]|uniref:cupin domain-containing protein n=1 Tax=unclassified Janthinobacterium TaxID=2610881 RepID=UPI000344981C|nr:cupin domain-containing protein [Janthinobacterium sp. CG3]
MHTPNTFCAADGGASNANNIGGAESFAATGDPADRLIARLRLQPTGIGGYVAPGPGGAATLLRATLPERFDGDRPIYSSNYFLLKASTVLQLHGLNQDEQWFFHQGSAIRLHAFADTGLYTSCDIGADLEQGQSFHGVARGQQWFGAELLGPGYALVSCSLAPAWDKRDSSRPSAAQISALQAQFPAQAAIIARLGSPS